MTPSTLDRYDLYELCVQSPGDLVAMLRAIHGREPLVLGEDFCGTAAVSRTWIQCVDGGAAIAVDRDPEPLSRAAGVSGLRLVEGDVVAATSAERDRVDVLCVGNFSIGEWHDRVSLVTYLRHARAGLRDHGVFVCDIYGGESAFLTGSMDLDFPGPGESVIRYTWEQRAADPLTGSVENALHFEFLRGSTVERTLSDAFVYRWRLWSVPELRDAMEDAGFARVDVYPRTPDAVDETGKAYVEPIPTPAGEALDDSFDVLIAARQG